MKTDKIIKVVLLLLSGLYIVLQAIDLEVEATILGAVILIMLMVLYVGWTPHKSRLFFLFLLSFTIAQVISYFYISGLTPRVFEGEIDFIYYSGNLFYMLSYIFLIIKMIRQLNFRKVFKELAIPILILVILDVFCVTLITKTTEGVFSNYEYALEYAYNALVMILLSLALVNYMYRNNNKSVLFLIGTIFIFFSEIIQLAYFYVLSDNTLRFVYSFFLVVAFSFFYVQSQYPVTEPIPVYTDEPLEEALD